MAVQDHDDLRWTASSGAEIARYALAALSVLTFGAGMLLFFGLREEGDAASEVEAAVILDLPPALASSVRQSDVAEGVQQQAADAVVPAPTPEHTTPTETPPEPPPQPPEPVAEPDGSRLQPAAEKLHQEPTPPPATAAAAREAMAPSGAQVPAKDAESTAGDAARSGSARAISRWQRAMLARLEATKSGTRSAGLSGTVNVGFTIDRSGRLLSSHVVRSSGSQRLDEAALALLQRASPFSDPPIGVLDAALAFTIPIAFTPRR